MTQQHDELIDSLDYLVIEARRIADALEAKDTAPDTSLGSSLGGVMAQNEPIAPEPSDSVLDPEDFSVRLVLSTVDGQVSAMLVCAECDTVLLNTNTVREAQVSELVQCSHTNRTSLWEYLGRPL